MARAVERFPRLMYQRWNSIANLVMFTCGSHWLIYVRTMLPPAGDLMLSFLVIDPDDLLRGWLKGYGYRSRVKMFGVAGKTKRWYEIPEIGEEIGQRLPLAGKIAGTRVGQGLRFVFMLDDVVQGALQWFVLIDQISKFLFGWSSGLLSAEECRSGGVYTRGGHYGAPGGDSMQQVPIAGGFTEVVSAGSMDGRVYLAGSDIVAETSVQLTASLSMSGVFPLGCFFFYRFSWLDESDRRVWTSYPSDTRWGHDNFITSVSPHLPPGRYRLVYEIVGSGCYTAMLNLGFVLAKPV